jgi:ATP-binding cassette, subfamily B, bacterial
MAKKNQAPRTNLQKKPQGPNIFGLVKPYGWSIVLLIVLTIAGNALNLSVPKLIGSAIDNIGGSGPAAMRFFVILALVAAGIFIFTYLQGVAQTYVAERVARDMRRDLIEKLSLQDYKYVQNVGAAKLLTNLTSDVDAVKTFISQAVVSLISSAFLLIGAAVLLIMIDVPLALSVLAIVPLIGFAFFSIFSRIRKLFIRSQETIDWLNKVINESILGAALIRILNSQELEYQKFLAANTEAKNVGLSILRLFASLIPVITFTTNLAMVVILALGGHFVITGRISLGDLSAFYNYMAILIFPIIVIGFISNLIAQASASYGRIVAVLNAEVKKAHGLRTDDLTGELKAKNLTLVAGEKTLLKDVSFEIKPGTRTAVIGPTAAGKTQLLYLLIGLIDPTSGSVEYDGHDISEYEKAALHRQIGFVFQDSIIFNLTLRENIAFSNTAKNIDLDKAIAASELDDFINGLPGGLDTVVSERGSSLSGGQKQRLMLARALTLDPKILLLDDFTARLDQATEKKILDNVRIYYPHLTLISVTQKIASVEDYDNIILLEEGEVLAAGKHRELMATSPEYMQIYDSQRSTSRYELHPD